jgi:hypothetical protein
VQNGGKLPAVPHACITLPQKTQTPAKQGSKILQSAKHTISNGNIPYSVQTPFHGIQQINFVKAVKLIFGFVFMNLREHRHNVRRKQLFRVL